jgi:hypothetical protein
MRSRMLGMAMLRRLYGSPVVGANYYRAEIGIGNTGRKQQSDRFR